jgi:uncharacterized protein (TIGR00255 family)
MKHMQMKSMTGYGLSKSQTAHSQIEVSVRAVNGRFLETRFHLPREFVGLESDLKKILEKHMERGTIDIFVNRKVKLGGGSSQLNVNKDLAQKYYSAYKSLAKELKIDAQIHVETIARLPDVIKMEEASELTAAEKKAFFQTVEKACAACAAEREREGKSLKKDMEVLLHQLEKEVDEIQELREEVNQTLLQRFEQKIKARLVGIEIDSARLGQEIAMQIEKSDINEELSRLKEHIKNYRQLFHASGSQGKKLDFYTQELLREVNTIGSKSSVSKLTHSVVQAKTYIERLREQVQNVE